MATAISIGDASRTCRAPSSGILAGSSAKKVTPLSIGGDHFVTYPILKACAKAHGPMGFVHFDAHRDVEPDPGGRIDHGTMFNYAIRDGLIDPKRAIQIGIRTCYAGENSYGMKILFADEVHACPPTRSRHNPRPGGGGPGLSHLRY